MSQCTGGFSVLIVATKFSRFTANRTSPMPRVFFQTQKCYTELCGFLFSSLYII